MMHFPGFHTTAFKTPEERAIAASLDTRERQVMIKTLLFPYPQFKAVTEQITKFHVPVAETGVHDAGVVGGLLGESRAGKSWVLKSYARRFPSVVVDDMVTFPVVYVAARDDWDALEFAKQLFKATGQDYTPKSSVSAMNSSVISRLEDHRTQLVILDDAHFVFDAKRTRKRNVSLLKDLSDANFCNVLLAGLPSVEAAMGYESQLKGRGGFPRFYVRVFSTTSGPGRENYRLLLNAIDNRLPFADSSGLASAETSAELMKMSGGSVGHTMNIVGPAALMALDAKTRCIQPAHLRAAATQRALMKDSDPSFGDVSGDGVDIYA